MGRPRFPLLPGLAVHVPVAGQPTTRFRTGILPEEGGQGGLLRLYNPLTRYQSFDIAAEKRGDDITCVFLFLFPGKDDGSSAGVEARVESGGRSETIRTRRALTFRAGTPLKITVVYPRPEGSANAVT